MLKWILLAVVLGAVAFGANALWGRRTSERRRLAREEFRERARANWEEMVAAKNKAP